MVQRVAEKWSFERVVDAENLFKILSTYSASERNSMMNAHSDYWVVTVKEYENGALTLSIRDGDYEQPEYAA